VEDFDNDGNLDFITNLRSNIMYFFRGKGKINDFYPPVALGVPSPGSYAIGKDAADMNNDGNIDLVAGGTTSNIVNYYEGNGDGTFKTPASVTTDSASPQYSVTTADFNDDFNADILTKYRSGSSPSMKLTKGKGDGKFYDPVNTNIGFSYGWDYAPADAYDFNYDGKQDIIILKYDYSDYQYYFYYHEGKGDGTFAPESKLTATASFLASVATPPRVPLGRCVNLTLNIGDDKGSTSPQISFTGLFDSEETINLAGYLNGLLSGSRNDLPLVIDEYGNEMYRVPLRFESDTIGSVMLYDLDIKYKYIATVELLPGLRYNLTTDLNDLLPTDDNESGEINVYFGVHSNSPGRVRLSDLHIEYNGAPESMGIPRVTVYEDSDMKGLLSSGIALNLVNNFTDDYDDPSNLSYGIYSNSDPKHIALSMTDKYYLRVNCTLVPNWYGTALARVWCRDSEGIEVLSNEFEVRVEPVNDPPIAYRALPNIELKEHETRAPIDLDDPKKEYFIDVDSELLYYRAVLVDTEQYGEQLEVDVDPETNVLRVRSIVGYAKNIEVKVYCDDDIELLSMSTSELGLVETYQILLVNVTSTTATFPPQWLPITLPPFPEDQPQVDILRLYKYVTDPDDSLENLSFSINSISESGYIDITIDDEGYLSIYPKHDFDGMAYVTLAVTDDEHNRDLTNVEIEVIPSNDLPVVEIVEPANGSVVSGVIEIIGSAYDAEDELSLVEIRIGDDGSWVPVNGLTYWTYDFDVDSYEATHKGIQVLLVKARAEDATGNRSLSDKVYLYLRRPKVDRDEDGVPDNMDRFPDNPSEWQDSDDDGYGDNIDKFKLDATQWNDTDSDGYGDNPDGNSPDRFPYDPTQWEDIDGDGHGDNPRGNAGDYYRNDPERWLEEEEASLDRATSEEDDTFLLALLGLIVVIVLTLMVSINYLIKWNKYKTAKTEE
jgi:hypothetical protein